MCRFSVVVSLFALFLANVVTADQGVVEVEVTADGQELLNMDAVKVDGGDSNILHIANGTLGQDNKIRFGWMRSSNDILEDGGALRSRLEADGYLYVKKLIPREVVMDTFNVISNDLLSQGVLESVEGETLYVASHVLDSVDNLSKQDNSGSFKPSGGWKLNDMSLLAKPEVQRMFAGEEIFAFFDRLFGEQSLTFDYKWVRPVPPGAFTGFHVDKIYMGKGSDKLLTCWSPLMPINMELGGLVVVDKSNQIDDFAKLRETYGEYDVDTGDVHGYAWYTTDPDELMQFGPNVKFLTPEQYEMGDIVVFTMKTMHGSLKNMTPNKIRLSVDMRFQPKDHPTDYRWMGETPGHVKFTPDNRHNPNVFPKTIDDKKCEWGLPAVCEKIL